MPDAHAGDHDHDACQVDGRDRANLLIAHCEDDFNLMQAWFGGISLLYPPPITIQISPGPAASAHWGPPITLTPGNGSDLTLVRYLLVSEVTEMFMQAQNKGWFGAGERGQRGEGLSRFLAAQFLIANGLGVAEPGFQLVNSWMNSPRADYVNNVDPLDHGIDAKTGCAILFIYYLHVQLGHSRWRARSTDTRRPASSMSTTSAPTSTSTSWSTPAVNGHTTT
jgi:hypothetical protein